MTRSRKTTKHLKLRYKRRLFVHPDEAEWLEAIHGLKNLNRIEVEPFFVINKDRPLLKVYSVMEHNGPAWVVEYPRLKGVVGTEQSIKKAIKDLEKNTISHLEAMRALGLVVPEEFR